ncbi:MAG: hypothetical protein P4M11_08170 [Candidatus Pacebacteria bacterium]|nr:hypothetical protein [Candidatus Paceibacterota bacterium]
MRFDSVKCACGEPVSEDTMLEMRKDLYKKIKEERKCVSCGKMGVTRTLCGHWYCQNCVDT